MKNKNWFGIVLIIAFIAVFAGLYGVFKEKPADGVKEIVIEVINQADEVKIYEVKTEAEFLQQAMKEAEGLKFSGTEDEFGLMLETVNGESAVYEEDNAYWCIMVNGEYGNYGIGAQPIEDGDVFQIVYTEAE